MSNNVVKKYIDLFRLKNVKDGTIYQVEETDKYYKRHGHNWDEMTKVNIQNGGPTISLYELNQASIIQFPILTKEKIQEYKDKIQDWYSKNSDMYFMFLSHNFKYYTIFEGNQYLFNPTPKNFGQVVVEVISDFAKVYSISLDEENNAWEIWATLKASDKAPEIFYLFPYDKGVIHYD